MNGRILKDRSPGGRRTSASAVRIEPQPKSSTVLCFLLKRLCHPMEYRPHWNSSLILGGSYLPTELLFDIYFIILILVIIPIVTKFDELHAKSEFVQKFYQIFTRLAIDRLLSVAFHSCTFAYFSLVDFNLQLEIKHLFIRLANASKIRRKKIK